jgi:beta-lactam-binding protein with PASTA domain
MIPKNLSFVMLIILPFACFLLGYLICSACLGNKSYPTPTLIGLSLPEALAITSPMHINIHLAAQQEHAGFAPGTIVSQKPAPARLIKPHQSIMVITSKLPEIPTAPDFSTMSLKDIERYCTKQKITLKNFKVPCALPTGYLVGQYPAALQAMHEPKMIVYFAKQETQSLIMPELTDQPLCEVVPFLQQQNIDIQVLYNNQVLLPPFPENMVVLAQKPAAGSTIPTDQKILVQLAVGIYSNANVR